MTNGVKILLFCSLVLPGTIQLFAVLPSVTWGGGALKVQGASHHPNLPGRGSNPRPHAWFLLIRGNDVLSSLPIRYLGNAGSDLLQED